MTARTDGKFISTSCRWLLSGIGCQLLFDVEVIGVYILTTALSESSCDLTAEQCHWLLLCCYDNMNKDAKWTVLDVSQLCMDPFDAYKEMSHSCFIKGAEFLESVSPSHSLCWCGFRHFLVPCQCQYNQSCQGTCTFQAEHVTWADYHLYVEARNQLKAIRSTAYHVRAARKFGMFGTQPCNVQFCTVYNTVQECSLGNGTATWTDATWLVVVLSISWHHSGCVVMYCADVYVECP